MDHKTLKERLFYAIVNELPICIDSYIRRSNSENVPIAGFSFDLLIEAVDGDVASDKMHVMLAQDWVARIVIGMISLPNEKLLEVVKLINELSNEQS